MVKVGKENLYAKSTSYNRIYSFSIHTDSLSRRQEATSTSDASVGGRENERLTKRKKKERRNSRVTSFPGSGCAIFLLVRVFSRG